VRVKDDRGGVGLVAEDDEGVGGRAFLMMVSANCLELSMGSKRAKAMCAAMRKTAKVRATLTVAARCFSLERSSQPTAGTDEQRDGGQRGGQAQRGKRWAGEVEEVGHGERVAAHAAVRQQGADVGHEGQVARVPQAPAEGRGGREHADDGEDGLRAGEPAVESSGLLLGPFVRVPSGRAVLFNAGQHAGDEDEQRRPDREGVVLLVGGDGEEEQSPGGEEAQQPDGADAELERKT
jgi:hypothetical protein